MKSPFKQITAFTLALSFIVTSTGFALSPKSANAQGKATACAAGYIAAGLSALASIPQNILGVPKSQVGDTAQNVTTGGSANALSFNECILKPIAKIMIITIIRNIGASIVSWVNSGFDGKPTFVTDFGGTLINAADEVAGRFIEGSELGFLCNNFSFQIRIALALKYSQPFRAKATCTLTEISGNINDFAESNGGVGWDNWLRLTTEPQNNIYGAYVIADSELSQRMLTAVTQKKDRISIGKGFLDFETCDREETTEEVNKRLATVKYGTGGVAPVSGGEFTTTVTRENYVSPDDPTASSSINRTKESFTSTNTSIEKQCLEKTVKTPGGVIAEKLNSSFAQGDIQAAVAQEIDDVIAATMNQLAQKMIQGAYGLLGLSKKRSGSSQSYLQKYQNQYYNDGGVEAVGIETGATSEIEDYTISNYDEAANIVENNSLVQDINTTTENTANAAVAQNTAQQSATNDALGVTNSSEQNLAFNKTTSQSSTGDGSSSNAVNGVKDGEVTQYNKPARTGEDQNSWWEVDLGSTKTISEIRIWKVTNKPVSQTLETIRVIASNAAGADVWTSDAITPTQSGPNPIVVPINLDRRYIRIEKQASLDSQCRQTPAFFRGEVEYESCYHPLELMEVEVISPIKTSTSVSSTANTNTTTSNTTSTAPKTINLVVESKTDTVTQTIPFNYKINVTANYSTSSLSVRQTFKRNDQPVRVGDIFSDLTVKTQPGNGATGVNHPDATVSTMQWNQVSVTNTDKFNITFTGTKKSGAVTGEYSLVSELLNSSGTVLKTQTTDFVVQ